MQGVLLFYIDFSFVFCYNNQKGGIAMPATNFTFRMPDELRQKLEERADKEGRTLSNLIIFLLKEAASNEQSSNLHNQK